MKLHKKYCINSYGFLWCTKTFQSRTNQVGKIRTTISVMKITILRKKFEQIFTCQIDNLNVYVYNLEVVDFTIAFALLCFPSSPSSSSSFFLLLLLLLILHILVLFFHVLLLLLLLLLLLFLHLLLIALALLLLCCCFVLTLILLCFLALLWFALLCITLCFLLCFALLCFALLCFALLCFPFLCFAFLFLTFLYLTPDLIVNRVTELDSYKNPTESLSTCYARSTGDIDIFGGVIFGIILFSCIVGNVICFVARNDENVNNEITYISLGIMNYFQIFLISVPLAVILEQPSLRFVLCVAG